MVCNYYNFRKKIVYLLIELDLSLLQPDKKFEAYIQANVNMYFISKS